MISDCSTHGKGAWSPDTFPLPVYSEVKLVSVIHIEASGTTSLSVALTTNDESVLHSCLIMESTHGVGLGALNLSNSLTIVWIAILILSHLRSTFRSSRSKIKKKYPCQVLVSMLLLQLCCSSVSAASFTTNTIGQSNPVPIGSNAITVTIVTDTNLSATDVVTITGLSNAVVSSPITLINGGDAGETMFSDGMTQGKGSWGNDKLTLTVYTELISRTTYTFAFTVSNSRQHN